MSGINSHADFLAATRDVRMVPKERLLNEATKNNYFFLSRMMKNQSEKFKGGTKLVDKVQGIASGNASWYDPNEEFTPRQSDTLTPIEVNWAFQQGHYVIIDETATLNAGDPNAYLDYVNSLELDCMVSIVNHLEESLWADANTATMEATNASQREMYSILAFVTQDGLAPSSTNTSITGADWTTVETINPSTNTWFQNANNTYTQADPDEADTGLIAAFDDMILRIGFEMPSDLRKWSEDEGMQKQVIVTNRDGIVYFKSRIRQLNDQMARFNDPAVVGPQFDGIPLRYVSELDNKGWTANQPDFLFLNLNFLFPFFHTNRYFFEKLTDGGSRQPNTVVNWKFTWCNVLCRSRRRQGRVYAA